MRILLATIIVSLLCSAAVARTVEQRLAEDRAFKLYVAIFKITQAPDGSLTNVQLTPSVDVRWQHEHPNADPKPVHVNIPKTYVAAAVKRIRAKHWPLFKNSGKTESFYTYFYYSPQLGSR